VAWPPSRFSPSRVEVLGGVVAVDDGKYCVGQNEAGEDVKSRNVGPRRSHEVTMKLTWKNVIVAIVLFCMFYAGATILRTGKFFLSQSTGPTINLEGPAAYVLGFAFIGFGLFLTYRVLGR
jgi:hypothetical protein